MAGQSSAASPFHIIGVISPVLQPRTSHGLGARRKVARQKLGNAWLVEVPCAQELVEGIHREQILYGEIDMGNEGGKEESFEIPCLDVSAKQEAR